ncbi:MAG: diguanylate cyclase (GGDEF)-like protein [Pseudohongiellaceae bacterium]|jgi:diguanylate cyclase (GGDEF)-like protein
MATTIQSHQPEKSMETYAFTEHGKTGNNTTTELLHQQRQLHISQVLQTSLELDDVLQLFFRELGKLIGIDSLGYRNEKLCLTLNIGKSGKNSCHYNLQMNDRNLGDLILTRDQRFSPSDLQFIESLIGSLVCPIRNALLYKEALQAALKDSLTQVGNRAAFDTAINREVNLSHRHERPLSLLVIDIDFFKNVNDSFGHSCGDTVLSEIAKTLMECCRETDACYRYGGEEFVIILNHTGLIGSRMISERIRKSIEKRNITHAEHTIKVTASIGIATLQKDEPATNLFDRADKALYSAKEHGRNQVAKAL